ncbi:hypothetical protein EON80_00030 [bacterium]|nr:MAG: hypothetical protein EON80_00030 [bacterium]
MNSLIPHYSCVILRSLRRRISSECPVQIWKSAAAGIRDPSSQAPQDDKTSTFSKPSQFSTAVFLAAGLAAAGLAAAGLAAAGLAAAGLAAAGLAGAATFTARAALMAGSSFSPRGLTAAILPSLPISRVKGMARTP